MDDKVTDEELEALVKCKDVACSACEQNGIAQVSLNYECFLNYILAAKELSAYRHADGSYHTEKEAAKSRGVKPEQIVVEE